MRWLLKRWWLWGVAAFIPVALVAGYLLIPKGHACSITFLTLPAGTGNRTWIRYEYVLPPKTTLLYRELKDGHVVTEGRRTKDVSLFPWSTDFPLRYDKEGEAGTLSIGDCSDLAIREGLEVVVGKPYVVLPGKPLRVYRISGSDGRIYECVIEVLPNP
jgi:hypothetical protein